MPQQIEKVAVLGLGTLGAQIALQAAYSGYRVTGYDLDPNALHNSLNTCLGISKSGNAKAAVEVDCWKQAFSKVGQAKSIEEAVRDADLVIEVVPEDIELKLKIWREIDKTAPPHAILATNSSSLPVSRLESAIKRPEMCLNLHFYQMVLGQNMADVMGGSTTKKEVLEAGKEFVRSLGVVALTVNKELLGFCFNRIWRAVKRESLHMWAGNYVDFQDIDKGWMIFNNTPWGPFGLMDAVGLDIVRDIEMVYYKESGDPKDHPPKALDELIREGRLGVKTGGGFYDYPNPEFSGKKFLS